jgi:hypothetical protein
MTDDSAGIGSAPARIYAAARPVGNLVPWVALALPVLLLVFYAPALGPLETFGSWTREDGIFESLGAIYFLAAALAFAAAYIRTRRHARNDWAQRWLRGHVGLLLLAGVMFVASMEEISWGQRILGVKTPEYISRVNRQKETNIHNLEFFHGHDRSHRRKSFWDLSHNLDRLFTVFSMTLGVDAPLAYRHARFRGTMKRAAFPVLSLWIGSAFVWNYLTSKALESLATPHAIVEIKEHNAAVIWFCLALGAWWQNRDAAPAGD